MATNNREYLPYHEDDQEEKKQPKRSMCFTILPLLLAVGVIGGIAFGTMYLMESGVFANDSPFSEQKQKQLEEFKNPKDIPTTCKDVPANERMVMFWQSEVEGCEKIPDGVSHVIWGFAEVENGVVKAEFQGHDATLKQCVRALRERCIKSLGSIGGANNVKALSEVKDTEKLADSIITMVEKYGFDGADIDDETVGKEYDMELVHDYVKKTSEKLRKLGNEYILTFGGLAFDADEKMCTDPNRVRFSRCYDTRLTKYVDWVNILAYNVNEDSQAAAKTYEDATTLNGLFPKWIKALGGQADKAVFGICIKGGCAYGDGPKPDVVSDWTKYSKRAGGMMIYAGSAEVDKFTSTKQIINDLK